MAIDRSTAPPILVRVTRGGLTESAHRGCVVAVDGQGNTVAALGDPETTVFLRSAAKPLQALPVIESGAADRYGLTAPEIAVMCGSLNGQDYQVAAVCSILDKIGLSASAMACGVHRPSHRPTAQALSRAGQEPTALHNNCAGKHAAMLVLCAHYGWDIEGYTGIDHPVQQAILKRVGEATERLCRKSGSGWMDAAYRCSP